MLKSLIAALLVILSLCLYGCSTGVSGLKSYTDAADGYEFVYPNGWIPIDVSEATEGVDVVFRDLVERTENLSVVISNVPKDQTLVGLGTPSEVGYQLLKSAIAPPGSERKAELINAESRKSDTQTYYKLEYEVTLPDNQERHNLASVAVSRGKLFTFNLSTPQRRWDKVKQLFKTLVNSFSVY